MASNNSKKIAHRNTKKRQADYREGIQAIDELRWSDAERSFQNAIRIDSEDHESFLQLSLLRARKKRFRDAKALAFKASRIARIQLSKTAMKQGWKNRSFRSYLRSLRTLTLVQYQAKERRNAMAGIQELLRLDPKDHLGVSYFFEALLAGKRWEEMTENR